MVVTGDCEINLLYWIGVQQGCNGVRPDQYLPPGFGPRRRAPSSATTRLRAVEWNVSRNGRITPVAVFDPVKLH